MISSGYDMIAPASPDGTLLAYSKPSGSHFKNFIFVSALDGSSPHQVSASAGEYLDIAWSPDGKQILVTANDNPALSLGD